jgi:hypothetical protein
MNKNIPKQAYNQRITSYDVCSKCGKKGAYVHMVKVQGKPSTIIKTAPVEYCKYCTPRTGIPRVTLKTGIIARLRKLFAG